MHTSIRAIILVSALGASVGSWSAGCSSDDDDGGSASTVNVCPTSLQEMETARCHEPFSCNVNYPCGSYPAQPAQCACVKDHFVCKDTLGANLDLENPSCVPPGGPNDKECPLNETAASGKSCGTAGLVCNYTSTASCPDSGVGIDTCQCVASTGADGGIVLRYLCEPKSCTAASDAGPTDSGHPADTGPG